MAVVTIAKGKSQGNPLVQFRMNSKHFDNGLSDILFKDFKISDTRSNRPLSIDKKSNPWIIRLTQEQYAAFLTKTTLQLPTYNELSVVDTKNGNFGNFESITLASTKKIIPTKQQTSEKMIPTTAEKIQEKKSEFTVYESKNFTIKTDVKNKNLRLPQKISMLKPFEYTLEFLDKSTAKKIISKKLHEINSRLTQALSGYLFSKDQPSSFFNKLFSKSSHPVKLDPVKEETARIALALLLSTSDQDIWENIEFNNLESKKLFFNTLLGIYNELKQKKLLDPETANGLKNMIILETCREATPPPLLSKASDSSKEIKQAKGGAGPLPTTTVTPAKTSTPTVSARAITSPSNRMATASTAKQFSSKDDKSMLPTPIMDKNFISKNYSDHAPIECMGIKSWNIMSKCRQADPANNIRTNNGFNHSEKDESQYKARLKKLSDEINHWDPHKIKIISLQEAPVFHKENAIEKEFCNNIQNGAWRIAAKKNKTGCQFGNLTLYDPKQLEFKSEENLDQILPRPADLLAIRFKDLTTNKEFIHVNIHQDFMHAKKIDTNDIQKIIEHYEKQGLPVVMSGDFNSPPGNTRTQAKVIATGQPTSQSYNIGDQTINRQENDYFVADNRYLSEIYQVKPPITPQVEIRRPGVGF